MDAFARAVTIVSDANNELGIFKVLWFLAANIIWVWVIAILLLVAAAVIDRIVSKVTLARLENAGIEEDPDILLRVNHLKQYFRSGNYINKAVDDVSFYIKKGEVFGLVGESGCGKTTTGRTIINLYDPTEGDVYFQGLRISSNQNGLPVLIKSLRNEFSAQKTRMEADLKEKCAANPGQKAELTAEFHQKIGEMKNELRQHIRDAKTEALESSVEKSKCVEKYREKRQAELTAQFEEDMKSLSGQAAEERKNRYEIDMKVAAKDNIMTKMQMIFQDPIASINPRMTVREIIAEGLKIRGIKDEKYIDEKVYEVLDLVGLVREHAARYPHEFSGGQRQRIGIARAIVLQPDLIIADEPISALDVSIQAQVINLLNDLRNRMGLTIMFIAHNLSVVKYFSDRIGVMYYGHLVELATSDELFQHPLHPYTKSLLSAIPYPDPHHEKYRKRIEYEPHKVHDYSVDQPTLREIRPGHFIRCNQAEFEAYQKELNV
ncbi:MAG: ATP-binding cassette domain-containing protein [Clostridia bacterium]|nr:ATP-binding cassette domain-containing protein [Clostridia bacterium]